MMPECKQPEQIHQFDAACRHGYFLKLSTVRGVIKGPLLPSEVKKIPRFVFAYLLKKTLRESAGSQPAPPFVLSLFLPSVERLEAERALSVPPFFKKNKKLLCVRRGDWVSRDPDV